MRKITDDRKNMLMSMCCCQTVYFIPSAFRMHCAKP